MDWLAKLLLTRIPEVNRSSCTVFQIDILIMEIILSKSALGQDSEKTEQACHGLF